MASISAHVKESWFDSEKVLKSVDRATRDRLRRFGYLVMRDARESIRTRKRPSSPGQPPSSHLGLLRRFIFFAYDPQKRSVVIGPMRLNRPGQAPHVLEYGRGRRAARPFMRPAFQRQLDRNMPSIWRRSVTR